MSGSVRLVQCPFAGQSGSVEVNLNETLLLINCPELLQRASVETKTKLSKLGLLLFTRVTNGSLQGYPDLIMTLADLGEGAPKEFRVVGPPPLQRGLLSFVMTLYRPDFPAFSVTQYSSQNCPQNPEDSDCGHKEHFPHCFPPFPVSDFLIRPIYISTSPKRPFFDHYAEYSLCHAVDVHRLHAELKQKTPGEKEDILCYAIHSPHTPGNLDAKKARSLGVPPGPEMGKLSRGESVETPDGRIVTPSECMSPSQPGGVLLVLDCPTLEVLGLLQQHPCLNAFIGNKTVNSIVHLAPANVLLDDGYAQWISGFGKQVLHQFIPPRMDHVPLQFVASNQLQIKLQKALGTTYLPPLFESSPENRKNMSEFENSLSSHLKNHLSPKTFAIADTLSSLQFHPPKKQKLCNKESKAFTDQFTPSPDSEQLPLPRVTFLGTAASVVSRYRGVSSVLVETEKGSVLIDAGSGTFTQLARLYGVQRAEEIILSLRCIWLSHKHADHCQGIIQILSEVNRLRRAMMQRTHPPSYQCPQCHARFDHDTSERMHKAIHEAQDRHWDYLPTPCGSTLRCPTSEQLPLIIIGPMWIQTLLEDSQVLEPLHYRFVDAQDLSTEEHPLQEFFQNELGFQSIQSVPMIHSYPTYGAVITCSTPHPWKLVYSADSRPSEALARIGKNATLLIHECTFDDAVQARAECTSHSTVTEALQVAKLMNADCVALTHFSTRFTRASFPRVDDGYFQQHPDLLGLQGKIIPAFDFLQLPLKSDTLQEVGQCLPTLLQLDLA